MSLRSDELLRLTMHVRLPILRQDRTAPAILASLHESYTLEFERPRGKILSTEVAESFPALTLLPSLDLCPTCIDREFYYTSPPNSERWWNAEFQVLLRPVIVFKMPKLGHPKTHNLLKENLDIVRRARCSFNSIRKGFKRKGWTVNDVTDIEINNTSFRFEEYVKKPPHD